jgi:Uma2 family endonuclease
VPETNENLERRAALYFSLKHALGASATIGSDQFVYWDPTTAKKRLAPDVFVRLGQPHRPFRVWKIWQRGAPDLGVEIISRSDEGEPDWDDKLTRYHAAGIGEVVRFDPEDDEATIRIWDLVEGDLMERAADDPDLHACEALGLWWVVVQHDTIGPMLRLARDREGRDLLPTPEEEAAKAREGEIKAREESARAREGEIKAREEFDKAREKSVRALEENERLQAELAALRALVGTPKPKPRKQRS